jgi:hypothetical protein
LETDMSELNLQPELDLAGAETALRGLAPYPHGHDEAAARTGTRLRGPRRRLEGARLRLPSDDGFHLFRVY